ncbi:gamma-glutamyl-gamma-aminobutyrate hydrolase family protein [Crassaminicella thermophila]|uniref:Gamma-glutamyl-gamma-aminobutyrate hydrolase family protein n=1 Tax=Crassaminicella thermophila TaxID=2599308 RepID=A0A5C0SBA1_CRATE|nr:gamma-glutamyl-gamma-aminobutyrate hydrolase family protein [Crassaminicella thermophila]QEK10966.1 gamma-glutamyl-gamma-aminobutyrate hydrolase family protein [Crassaminicella thermophila]
MRPMIGITTYYVKNHEGHKNKPRGMAGQDMLMSTMDYSRCIQKADGIPLTIPVIDAEWYMDELVDRLDGFLFTGGPDIYPIHYHQPLKTGVGRIVPERDAFELKLMKKVLEKDKPILGICRGFQLINVYFGGTLYQDLYTEKITSMKHVGDVLPKYYPAHKVRLKENSKVFEAFDKNEIFVNSFHHQAVEKIGEGLIETGWSEDGIVEGLEHKNYSFVVGVQWHPEMMAEIYDEQLSIFKLFINAIKNK